MLYEIGSIAASAAVGAEANKSISQGNIAGILVVAETYQTIDQCQIVCNLRTEEKGQDVLIPQMPLWPLVERADYMGGVGLGAIKEKSLQATTDAQEGIEIDQVAAFIPLGQIALDGDDELDTSIVVTTALGASDGLKAWYVDFGPAPEHILKVVEQGIDNATFKDPEEVWIYRTGAAPTNDKALSALTAGQLTVNQKIGDESYSVDAKGYWGLAAAIGKFEGTGPRRTVPVYLDKMNRKPGANIALSITGTAKADYSVFAVERVVHAQRTMRVQAEQMVKRAELIEKLEQKDPARAKSLQVANKLEIPSTLRAMSAGIFRAIPRILGGR